MFTLRIDDGLSLRLLEERHAEPLFHLMNANREHLGRWFSWVEQTTKVEHVRDFIRRGLRKFADGNGFECAVLEAGSPVGMLGAHYVDWGSRKTELGYWLAHDAQGRGLMTAAVGGLVAALFADGGLRRVEIRCHVENVRSRAIPERLGFTHEGVLRSAASHRGKPFDLAIYSLLATDAPERDRAADRAIPRRGERT